jgi:hypothetical protein
MASIMFSLILLNVSRVAEQFSISGGVRQFLRAEAETVVQLVRFCYKTTENFIAGAVEGTLDHVHSYLGGDWRRLN